MNYTDRVAKGAATLDEILPGWERKIDLDKLRLESDCNCVLGQLSVDLLPEPTVDSGYAGAIERYCPHENMQKQYLWGAERGFAYPTNSTDILDIDAEDEVWDDLTEAWKRLIRQRLEA